MEIIQQEKLEQPKSLKILFYFLLFILFFSIIAFFVLNFFLSRGQSELKRLEAVYLEELSLEKLIMEKEVLGVKKRIDNLSFLIDQQVETSKFFQAFEEITHHNIWFSNFNLSLKEEKIVTLSGHARNFQSLEEQLFIMKNTDWIEDFTLGTVTMAEGRMVDFSLSLFLSNKIF